MGINQVEQMPVYRQFYALALRIERETKDINREFHWLRNQVLRSSESVCANMAEGFYSQYSTEYLQSLYRCRREARETMVHLQYASDTNQIAKSGLEELLAEYEASLLQLAGLISSIERKITERGKAKTFANRLKEDFEDYDSSIFIENTHAQH